MQLIGQTVSHRLFGKGVIADYSGEIVTVDFPQGEKRFLYPDAFRTFLTLKNPEAQEKIDEGFRKEEQKEKDRWKKAQEKQVHLEHLRRIKVTPHSQAAYDMASPDELKTLLRQGVTTGCYQSGSSKGQPRIPARLKPNSACLLTALPAGGSEEDRRILGVFMVPETFYGTQCWDGHITSHERFRLALPEGSSLPYWNYTSNLKNGKNKWGSSALRWMTISELHRVMEDIVIQCKGHPQEALAEDLLRYFRLLNHLEQ